MSDPNRLQKLKDLIELAEKTACVIVGKDEVGQPLNARSIARDKKKGRPDLPGAFALAQIKAMDEVPSTYILPDDSVLLMIGNTDELKAVCQLANETAPRIDVIRTKDKELQLRYARIQVSRDIGPIRGQTDTLIALGVTLPAASPGGWRQEAKVLTESVTTEYKDPGKNAGSLPGWIELIKSKDTPETRLKAY